MSGFCCANASQEKDAQLTSAQARASFFITAHPIFMVRRLNLGGRPLCHPHLRLIAPPA
jgi:hypothetical protein